MKGEVPWKDPRNDVSMPLRFELAGLLRWLLSFATLEHSVQPGPALEDPFVRLLSAQLASARSRGNVRRDGAQPNTAQLGLESKRCSNCLGYHPSFSGLARCFFHPLPCIIVVTLEDCFCERVNLVVSSDFLSFLSRGRLV